MDTALIVAAAVGLAAALAAAGLYLVWDSRFSHSARLLASRLEGAHAARKKARPVTRAAGPTIAAAAGLAAFAAITALGRPPLAGAAVGLMVAAAPWAIARRRAAARRAAVERQLPEALDLMSSALRAGHALQTALKMVADEMPAPVSVEFGRVHDEINFGVPLQDALGGLASRMPLDEVRYLVVAVLIQRESGGNLAELLDNVAALIRQRVKLHGHIRTLSAEGRLSARILAVLPFGLALAFGLINPRFADALINDPAGPAVIAGALAMMAAGGLWMRAVIRIRV